MAGRDRPVAQMAQKNLNFGPGPHSGRDDGRVSELDRPDLDG